MRCNKCLKHNSKNRSVDCPACRVLLGESAVLARIGTAVTWTEQQNTVLRNLWGQGFTREQIAARMGLTYSSVRTQAGRLKLRQKAATVWTDQAVELLRKMHAQGHSFTDMAAALGVTRNAAIGKAGRLKLPMRREGQNPIRSHEIAQRVHRPKAQRKTPLHTTAPPARYVPPPIPANAPAPRNLDILQLEPGDCRYPVTPDHPMLFCGHSTINELPYCPHHARVAYQPARPRR